MNAAGANEAMRAVTISREYGSGGGEVAVRLARHLGWHVVDHEIVAHVARLLKESEGGVEAQDEHATSFVWRLLDGLQMGVPWYGADAPVTIKETTQRYHQAVTQVITAAYREGQAVIVGRGGQAVLAGQRDVLHIRIIAPLEQRVSYVVQREGLTPHGARERIRRKDEDRMHYLREYYHQRPDDAALYDLVVNTGILTLDAAVALTLLALDYKGARLSVPAEALGPGGGLAPYPGRPQELMPARPTTGLPNTQKTTGERTRLSPGE